jgi:hypothetical protein
MTERPILFSGPMVRALLAGTKTQTRRIVKPQPEWIESSGRWRWPIPKSKVVACDAVVTASREWWEYLRPEQYPYGAPGDRLWVRETWAQRGEMRSAIYRADAALAIGAYGCVRWRPSIFMPRWASRITLDVTAIRVERLQAITPDDAKAEGIQCSPIPGRGEVYSVAPHRKYCYENGKVIDAVEYAGPPTTRSPIRAYEALWDSINGTRDGCGWDANPWVWVVEFRRAS